MADVMDIAWKLPPWWARPPSTSMSGLSVVELSSIATCLVASFRSSSCGPSHSGAVRSAYGSRASPTWSGPFSGESFDPARNLRIFVATSTWPVCGRTPVIKGS